MSDVGWPRWRTALGGVVIVAGLLLGWVGFQSVRDGRPVLIEFLVPRDYSGWLVVSWNCDGGVSFDDAGSSSRRFVLTFPETGALCLTDDVPADGYVVLGYRRIAEGDGLDDDYGRISSLFLRTGPKRVLPGIPGASTVQPACGGDAAHRYDIAWVESRPELLADASQRYPREPVQLGDRCDLDRFMRQRFSEPGTATSCGTIPARQAAGLSG